MFIILEDHGFRSTALIPPSALLETAVMTLPEMTDPGEPKMTIGPSVQSVILLHEVSPSQSNAPFGESREELAYY